MKVLIVYDSVSPNKNTEKVAETIRDILKTEGTDVQNSYAKDVNPLSVKDYDCLFVGSPTHARRSISLIRDFLDNLKPQSYSGKSAATFDTRVKWWGVGSTTGGIESKLRQLGFKIDVPGLATYVQGEQSSSKDQKKSLVVLLDGELEKAKEFA